LKEKGSMSVRRLSAILAQRCPVCLKGAVFNALLGMNKRCPLCGVPFERETGYFLNAMFVAYAIGFLFIIPTAIYLYFLNVSVPVFSVIILVEMAVLWPLIFRYSRVIWLHIDQIIDPRQAPPQPDTNQT
jgi:uncharacterized protein (DUF983 family)